MAERFDVAPLRFGVRFGDARRFVNAGDAHLVRERAFAFVGGAGYRRGVRWKCAARERQMAFAGKQARRRVETDPPAARQINFAPGMEISEIMFGAGRAIESLHIGGKLNQVTGNKARRQTETTADLHEQPSAVAARS